MESERWRCLTLIKNGPRPTTTTGARAAPQDDARLARAARPVPTGRAPVGVSGRPAPPAIGCEVRETRRALLTTAFPHGLPLHCGLWRPALQATPAPSPPPPTPVRTCGMPWYTCGGVRKALAPLPRGRRDRSLSPRGGARAAAAPREPSFASTRPTPRSRLRLRRPASLDGLSVSLIRRPRRERGRRGVGWPRFCRPFRAARPESIACALLAFFFSTRSPLSIPASPGTPTTRPPRSPASSARAWPLRRLPPRPPRRRRPSFVARPRPCGRPCPGRRRRRSPLLLRSASRPRPPWRRPPGREAMKKNCFVRAASAFYTPGARPCVHCPSYTSTCSEPPSLPPSARARAPCGAPPLRTVCAF